MDKINCFVDEDFMGHLTVTFEDKTSIYLQTDYERAQFGVDCGVITAPDNWDGQLLNLPEDWWQNDFEEIASCPDHYKNNAE